VVPHAVVDQLGIAQGHLLLEVQRLAIEAQRLQLAVSGVEDGAAGCLVDAARLHAHQPVLHQVDAADAVLRPQSIQCLDDGRRRQLHAVNRYRHALVEGDLDDLGFVRCALGRSAQLVHRLFRLVGRVFQDATLVREVPHVGVAAVDRLLGVGDGYVVEAGVSQCILARADLPFAPWSDDLQRRVERLVSQFEAHLVVTLAGAAVGHGVGPFGFGHGHLPLGDERPGDGRAQQVASFVDRTGLHHGKQKVLGELVAQVFDDDLAGSAGQPLGLQPFKLVVALTDVGAEADDFAAIVFAQPGYDDGCVQATGVGQDDFVHCRFGHDYVSLRTMSDRWGGREGG